MTKWRLKKIIIVAAARAEQRQGPRFKNDNRPTAVRYFIVTITDVLLL